MQSDDVTLASYMPADDVPASGGRPKYPVVQVAYDEDGTPMLYTRDERVAGTGEFFERRAVFGSDVEDGYGAGTIEASVLAIRQRWVDRDDPTVWAPRSRFNAIPGARSHAQVLCSRAGADPFVLTAHGHATRTLLRVRDVIRDLEAQAAKVNRARLPMCAWIVAFRPLHREDNTRNGRTFTVAPYGVEPIGNASQSFAGPAIRDLEACFREHAPAWIAEWSEKNAPDIG